jgi:hypothetical protein
MLKNRAPCLLKLAATPIDRRVHRLQTLIDHSRRPATPLPHLDLSRPSAVYRTGHYVALVRNGDKWLLYEDESVELVNEGVVQSVFGSSQVRALRPEPYPETSAGGFRLQSD